MEYAKRGELTPDVMKNLDNAIYETIELSRKRDQSGIDSPFYDKANETSRKRRDELNDIWSAQRQFERDRDRLVNINNIEKSYEPGMIINTRNNPEALEWIEYKSKLGNPIDVTISDLPSSRERLNKLPKGSVIRYRPGNEGSRYESQVLEELINNDIQVEIINSPMSMSPSRYEKDKEHIKDVSNYINLVKRGVRPVDFGLEKFLRKNKT